MVKDLSEVSTYRQGVLLACAGAILHNLGKVSSEFVEMQLGILRQKGKYYFYQNIVGLIHKRVASKISFLPEGFGCGGADITPGVFSQPTKDAVLKPIGKLPPPFDDRSYCLGDLIEFLGVDSFRQLYQKCEKCRKCKDNNKCASCNNRKHKYNIQKLLSSSSLLTHLMNRCHHGASGGEKQDIYELQQELPLYIATPFGFERLAPEVPLGYDSVKEQVEKVVQKHLATPEDFSLHKFMSELETPLRRVPGDTRRAVNDVTVWDVGHSGMAFLKAGIWSAEDSLEHDHLAESKNKKYPSWRLWQVGINGLDYLTGAISVADLRVRQRALREYLESVRFLLEEEYPIATEVYRDENGGIYVFPDWENDEEIRKILQANVGNDTSFSLTELYGLRPAVVLSAENYHNHPECKDWGNVRYIGEAVLERIRKPPAAEPFLEAYEKEIRNDLCPYCGLRPIGGGGERIERLPDAKKDSIAEKARERKICQTCLESREMVTKEWWEKSPYSTIWVDEVADVNGRVALVVGKFDVEKMLGELVYPYDIRCKYTVVWYDDNLNASSGPPPGTKLEMRVGRENKEVEWDGTHFLAPGGLKRYRSSMLKIREFDGQKVSSEVRIEIKRVQRDTGGKKLLVLLENDDLLTVAKSVIGTETWGDIAGKKIKANDVEWEITRDYELTGTVSDGKYKQFLHMLKDKNTGAVYYAELVLCSGNKFLDGVSAVPSTSFARFRRVWEVTARFWQEVAPLKEQIGNWQEYLAESEAVEALRSARQCRRLELVLEKTDETDELLPFHAYELEIAGVSLGIVPISSKGKEVTCVTIENLGYIARQLGGSEDVCGDPCRAASWVQQLILKNLLREKEGHNLVRLKVAGGYGLGRKDLGAAKLLQVQIHDIPFFPVVPILAEPRIFAVLLPARAAVELVRRIYRKYEREMGKVRWRLPLTLGTVFFPRHLPLRIVLDAGWRLLKREPKPIKVEITGEVESSGYSANDEIGVHPRLGTWPTQVKVRATVSGPEPSAHGRKACLEWEVPTVMGDKKTFDIWYPWVKLISPEAVEDRPLFFKGDGGNWLHVVELRDGDQIEFYPSTWDFVFLDGPAERFAIAYDSDSRRLGLQRRPYYLEEIEPLVGLWKKVKKGLSSAQRHNLWQILLSHYSRWCGEGFTAEVWQQFCRDALLNAEWRKTEKNRFLEIIGRLGPDFPELSSLWGAAASGVLFDLFELFMTILKEGD